MLLKEESGRRASTDFDRRVENLLQKGFPKLAGLSEDEFLKQVERLRAKACDLSIMEERDRGEGRVPYIVVVKNDRVRAEEALSLVELKGKRGFTSMPADDLHGFKPIDGLKIPDGGAYLLVDVDTGKDTLNVTPDDALERIERAGRSPLTIDEGIALITHYPEILRYGNCFSTLGSRCGDRRVPALWISGGRPRLGWCWAGNPHTWLGSASCAGRVGA